MLPARCSEPGAPTPSSWGVRVRVGVSSRARLSGSYQLTPHMCPRGPGLRREAVLRLWAPAPEASGRSSRAADNRGPGQRGRGLNSALLPGQSGAGAQPLLGYCREERGQRSERSGAERLGPAQRSEVTCGF